MSSHNNSSHDTFEYWEQYRKKIFSSKGGWKAGQDVYCHGHSIMHELLGNITYMQMIILNATGRLVKKILADMFDALFICLSWPDSRIWCNQIGALCGSNKTEVVAATVSGILAADSRIYGGSQTCIQGMQTIKNALTSYKKNLSIADIVKKHPVKQDRPMVFGYVRPVNGKDERIAPMLKLQKKLGIEIQEHLSLATKISDYLTEHYGEGMNILGYACAFSADHGFSGEELYRIRATSVLSGVTACFVDTANKTPETFLPLRCDDISYEGIKKRSLT